MPQPGATKDDYEHALAGLQFPVATDAVLRTARDHGGIDSELVEILEQLPETAFDSYEALLGAVHNIYRSHGVDESAIPV